MAALSVMFGGVRLGDTFGIGFDARRSDYGWSREDICTASWAAAWRWCFETCSGCVMGIPALNLGGVVMGLDCRVGTSGADARRGDSGSASWLCWVLSAG